MTNDLAELIQRQRWFGAKSRTITRVQILDSVELPGTGTVLNLVSIHYVDGQADTYFVPLHGTNDAVSDQATGAALLSLIESEAQLLSRYGRIQGKRSSYQPSHASLSQRLVKSEQSNSSIIFGDLLIMKLFRRQQPGENPDCEISRYLTEHTSFRRIPPFAGSLDYYAGTGELYTLAMLQGLVANEGDGLNWTLQQMAKSASPAAYVEAAATLGRRTAELHAALATFDPEPLEPSDLQQLADDMARNATRTLARLDQPVQSSAVLASFDRLRDLDPQSQRIRIHGDYHLGQILRVPDDFVILDFEGEPLKSLADRRAKHCPLKDVAGMLRSFSYVSYIGFTDTALEAHRNAWEQAVSAAFLEAYRNAAGDASFLPAGKQAFNALLEAYVLDKAFYELNYEIDNRPDWVRIPLTAVLTAQHREYLL